MNKQKPGLLIPALIGGGFLGVTSALPLLEYVNCACCLLVILGGLLASHLYLRTYPADLPPVNYGDAALLGVLTGLIGGLVWTAVGIPIEFLKIHFGIGAGEAEELRRILNSPEIPPSVRDFVEPLLTGPMSALMILMSAVQSLVLSLIFATVGAVIGTALFQKKTPPPFPVQPPAGPPPPPPAG